METTYKVCILNASTNVVEDMFEVLDINNVPSFLIKEGQVLATDHTGELGDTWNGSSYDDSHRIPVITDEERWEQVREIRNQLLAETDWTANSDVTMTEEMRAYRQELRDIPETQTDPLNIVYPDKP